MDPLSLMLEEEREAESAQERKESRQHRTSSLVQAVEEEDRRRANFSVFRKKKKSSQEYVHVPRAPESDLDSDPHSPSSSPKSLSTHSIHPTHSGSPPRQQSNASEGSNHGDGGTTTPRPPPRRSPLNILQASQMPPPPAWLTARLPDDWDSHGRIPQTSLYMNIKTYFVRLERMSLGTLYVTSYQLFFVASRSSTLRGPVAAPLGSIERITLRPLSTRQTKALRYMIEVECKNVRTLRFGFPEERQADCNKAFHTLQSLSFPPNGVLDTFAFFHKGRGAWPRSISPKFDGWKLYDPWSEYARMGLPDDSFRISEFNRKYEVCETYPSLLAVPAMMTEDELVLVADFRSKGRLPVLCWKSPGRPQTIWRCSQPRVGMGDARCTEDERLLKVIGRLNPEADTVPIFDARPKINAVGNKMAGKGFEVIENYPNCKLLFMNIQNIHNVRESYQKLAKACMSRRQDVYFSTTAINSGWLKHISEILRAVHAMVTAVHRERQSIVCHCSDGWDRTAQLVSLTQLCLDPYYRTTRGFFVLIEKDWISFGHKFRERMGQGDPNHSHDQRSPIFIQWLDAVYQLTLQFPRHFQFNSRLLCELAAHVYSCRFGTFLADSEKEGKKFELRHKTLSVWTYFLTSPAAARGVFTNPFYSPSGSGVREAQLNARARSPRSLSTGPSVVPEKELDASLVSPSTSPVSSSPSLGPSSPSAASAAVSPSSSSSSMSSSSSAGSEGQATYVYPAWQDLLSTTSSPSSSSSLDASSSSLLSPNSMTDGDSDPLLQPPIPVTEGSGMNHEDILRHNQMAANPNSGAVFPTPSGFPQPTSGKRREGNHMWRDSQGEIIYPAWSFKKLQLWNDFWLQWQSEEIPLLGGDPSHPGVSGKEFGRGAQTLYNSPTELMEREFQLAVRRIRELELENARLQQQIRKLSSGGGGRRRRRRSSTTSITSTTAAAVGPSIPSPSSASVSSTPASNDDAPEVPQSLLKEEDRNSLFEGFRE